MHKPQIRVPIVGGKFNGSYMEGSRTVEAGSKMQLDGELYVYEYSDGGSPRWVRFDG